MTESKTNAFIGLIGAVVFGVLAIIVPFLKMTGFGFITETGTVPVINVDYTADIFWDGGTTKLTGVPAVDVAFSDFVDSSIQIIWDIAGLWMFVFIGLGLIGFLLVAIPPVQKLAGMEPMNLGFFGLIAGLVATVVHYLLIVLGALLDEAFEGGIENLNLIMLVLMIVGWVALIVGYIYGSKD
ncbi:hypothetical protein CEE45_07710 [Candidatus Heimdallarchaeota archaeon B3_Heim]|nr:MAG: hypothetical protein CEE45_07710 [Candidatus Heimdallarchaeota archaeon B3_Heim]